MSAFERMSLKQIAEWARGSLRDELGPTAAAVVLAIETDCALYGRVTDLTRAEVAALDAADRERVVRFFECASTECAQ